MKFLKTELLYDPAIPLQDIYPEKNMIQKDTCTSMFIALPFTTVKTWKQPKCSSTEYWIKKLWYTYNGVLLSHKRNAFESVLMRWINQESFIQSEENQKEKYKYHTLTHIYGIQTDGTDEFICRAAMEKQT